MKPNNIGIALSGGGIRALLFHLGLFEWLAQNRLFEEVKRISSVSGASLCVGMIYAHNELTWPTSEKFLLEVLPSIKKALRVDLQSSALLNLLVSPGYWNKKVNIIARTLERKWGVSGMLSQLTGIPMWYVNCTTYETGKSFRFSRESMGDYTVGYVEIPDIPLSEVMAASAGFPVLIGPYSLKTRDYHWTSTDYSGKGRSPAENRTLHLWDGGVYDNLGLESVFKPQDSGVLGKGLDYLIVSNASVSIGFHNRSSGLSSKNLKRILDISMDQVTALRSRMVMDYIKRTGKGMYVKIGNSAEKITADSGCAKELKRRLIESCLSSEQAERAKNYPTTLKKANEQDMEMLIRHGRETADCTFLCYQKL